MLTDDHVILDTNSIVRWYFYFNFPTRFLQWSENTRTRCRSSTNTFESLTICKRSYPTNAPVYKKLVCLLQSFWICKLLDFLVTRARFYLRELRSDAILRRRWGVNHCFQWPVTFVSHLLHTWIIHRTLHATWFIENSRGSFVTSQTNTRRSPRLTDNEERRRVRKQLLISLSSGNCEAVYTCTGVIRLWLRRKSITHTAFAESISGEINRLLASWRARARVWRLRVTPLPRWRNLRRFVETRHPC